MAINETVITGRKFRRCIDATDKIWQRISFWHKACDCEFDDGTNAQSKLGAIKGITTDLNITTTGYAADMMAVKQLETEINKLNDSSSAGTVNCIYDAFGGEETGATGTRTITVKKDESNINFNTLIVFISNNYGHPSTFTVDNAELIKTIENSTKYYQNQNVQEYRLYDISGVSDSFTLNINFNNANSGVSYLILDKKFTDMNICPDIINYDSAYKNSLFVSCNMSDRRGYTFIKDGSEKYIVHKQSSRKNTNKGYHSYFENMFTIFSVLKDGYVSIDRESTTNQFGVTLRLE